MEGGGDNAGISTDSEEADQADGDGGGGSSCSTDEVPVKLSAEELDPAFDPKLKFILKLVKACRDTGEKVQHHTVMAAMFKSPTWACRIHVKAMIYHALFNWAADVHYTPCWRLRSHCTQ
jgi:hypothetical protein